MGHCLDKRVLKVEGLFDEVLPVSGGAPFHKRYLGIGEHEGGEELPDQLDGVAVVALVARMEDLALGVEYTDLYRSRASINAQESLTFIALRVAVKELGRCMSCLEELVLLRVLEKGSDGGIGDLCRGVLYLVDELFQCQLARSAGQCCSQRYKIEGVLRTDPLELEA